jgi:predicted lipoprotein with Yx(FWY)xxD motif
MRVGAGVSLWVDALQDLSVQRTAMRDFRAVLRPDLMSVNIDPGWAVSTVGTISPCPKADSIRRGAKMNPRWSAERGVETMKTARVGLQARAGMAIAAAVGIAILILMPGLEAAEAATPAGHGAVVVQVVNRSPVGNMLATTGGASLYIHPSGACTGSCLSVWPPLLMPAGKTKPKGAQCLTTVSTASGLQVSYHNQPLYTFTSDSGTSLNGNGVGGFKAAKINKKCP